MSATPIEMRSADPEFGLAAQARNLRVILGVAVAYFIAGWVSLDFAAASGSPVTGWGASGIALAAVVIAGGRIWPAVMLGSLVLEAASGWRTGANALAYQAFAPWVIVSAAATVQALLGARLIRRFGAFPYAPANVASLAGFFIFGGLIPNLIRPTVSLLAFAAASRPPVADAVLRWATWWAGDAISVLILATPILAYFCAPERERLRRVVPVSATLLAALSATALALVFSIHEAREDLSIELQALTGDFASHITTTLTLGASAVGGLAGLFEGSAERNLADFRGVASRLVDLGLGIQAIEWIPRVEFGAREEFEARIGGEWNRAFAINERSGDKSIPVAPRPEYFPVSYAYPLQGNEAALGYDLGSDPDRDVWLQAARASGHAVATPGLRLVQNGKMGILLFRPVYSPLSGWTARSLKGFALGVFAVGDLLNVALNGRDTSGLEYSIVDETEPGKPVVLAGAGPHAAMAASSSNADLRCSAWIKFGERIWAFRLQPTDDYIDSHRARAPYSILLGGLIFSAVAAAFALIASDRRRELEHAVAERTHELVVTQDVTVRALATLAETRDNDTGAHIKRTQYFLRRLALELRKSRPTDPRLTDRSIELMFKAAPLHDIGKVGIPDRILLKPSKLTPEEFEIMKGHAVLGRQALLVATDGEAPLTDLLRCAIDIVGGHHEKWDGTGYPDGLAGEAIPLSARLMAVADVYDALTNRRVYRPALGRAETVAIIEAGRGAHFDPEIVDAFLACLNDFRGISERHVDRSAVSM